MESSLGPNPIDEPSLLYKLQRKIKVFNTSNPLPNKGYNLVACSSKYGLVFVGTPDRFLTVYHLKDLVDKDCEPQHITINLQEAPTHIAVSSDQELLAVTGGQLLSVYNIYNFQNTSLQPINIPLNKTSTFVSGLQWNPIIADSLAMVFYDGSLLVANISTSQVKMVQSKARCLCWSPKGKQLVTGNSDGTLTQYKPDLTPAKNIPAPKLFDGAPIEALAVYWISTFMFTVVFKNATDNSRPVVTVVNTPKVNPPHCLNYEDICYSMGTNRPWYYYLQAIPQWSLIMASSSNSMEIATLGSKKDGESWTQWCQSDEARPELPLTDKKIENFPIGISIDTSAIYQLPMGENQSLHPMPLLHVLSQNGLLTIFNVINLSKDAPQLCTPPQQFNLPAAAMTSVIPGKPPAVQPTPAQAPPPAPAPLPTQTKEQAAPLPLIQKPQGSIVSTSQQQPPAPPPQYSVSVINIPRPPSYTQPPISQGHSSAVQGEQKQVTEIKPTPIVQPKAVINPPLPVEPKPQTAQQAQENAALKAEQERIGEMKANQQLKNMLVKEVNDFQKELYRFTVKTRETQAKLQRDIDSMKTNFVGLSISSEQLKKECFLDDMRGAIVQLKLELVRACAVIAEARTHAEAKDYHQWTQADPLTTKRVASIKKLAYYVENQLEQAQKALDYKWNEALRRDPHFNKPGQRMIRPILDDVYQPLVKQQEILSRQQAVLRTLRNTLKDCDVLPMFKSTSLLRNTPFKNKDPLSKLTKNILNMSIEPETTKEPLLSSQKLDALRDMLSNHKTVKIKPVNVEMKQHLANMKLNYAKTLKENSPVVSPSDVKPEVNPVTVKAQVGVLPNVQVKTEPKQEPMPTPKNTQSFTPPGPMKPPVPSLTNVARTLFTDELKSVPSEKAQMPSTTPKNTVSAFISQYSHETPVTPLTSSSAMNNAQGSVLKDLLQNRQTSFEPKAAETKDDSNTFMGQKICSPSTFAFSSSTISPAGSTATNTTVFATKPTSEVFNIFNKFQPQSFVPESKPFVPETTSQTFEPKPQPSALETKPLSLAQESKPQSPGTANSKSSETGEPEAVETKTFTLKPKVEKPLTCIFGAKTATSISSANVPDVLKTTQDIAKAQTKTSSKTVEKENLPEKSEVKVIQKPVAEKKDGAKNLTIQMTKTSIFGAVPEDHSSSSSSQSSTESTPTMVKTEPKVEPVKEKPVSPTSSASSIFAAGNATVPDEAKPSPLKLDEVTSKPEPVTPASTPVETVPSLKPSIFSSTNSSTAASVFGAAIAAQAKNTSQAGSIFAAAAASSPLTSAPIFGSTSKGSIFGSSQTSIFAPTTTATSTTTTESSALNSQTSDSPTKETISSTFGSPVTTSQTTSIFGSSVFPTLTTTSSTTPVFGSSTTAVFASATTKASVFDATTTTPSVFSSTPSAFTPTTQTTQTSVFGANTTTATTTAFATSGGSVFASAAANSNSATVFGGQSTTTQASSIFGSATATNTSAYVTPPSTTQASIFGTPPPTTQTSVLGTPPPTTQASIFGTPPPTTQASIFGTPPPTTQASVFGSTPAQTSVFGTSDSTAAQSTSLFGGADANLFAAASISTTSAPSQSSGGSIFGGSSSGSVFGSNTNVFGNKATFGQPNPTAASIFGAGGATTFGQKPNSNFWTGGSGNTEGGFGSSGGGFGQQATTQASSIFGGSTGGSFSSPSAGQGFGTPQQSVFSTPQQQSSTEPAFGGSTVFGGNQPGFGSPASFGSPSGGFGSSFGGGYNKSPNSGFGAPAAFGGGATFGGAPFGSTSPGKVYGGGNAAPAFSSTQSNATFESLATQNTLTFGNLAQQSGPTQQPAPTFNTSPSFTGWRG
ncbi:unnamed protein product [Arctia plantaginis]|uniref:Nucleoporin Nup159/Nup146 N-terminal domain-containing protein n=1 Tax=Arctia plantaginis TaxID=874455 RepID=A0A8S0ZAE0_ARCPL|nr:unnamed protein product [Arctia plantaginis]